MANGSSNPDTPWWSPVDDEGELDPEFWSGGMDVDLDPRLAAELGVDLMPVVGDIKALTYDMPRSLRDMWNAPTAWGKVGHGGLATIAGLSALPVVGKPFDFLRAALKARKLKAKELVRRPQIQEVLKEMDEIPPDRATSWWGRKMENARLARMAEEGFDTTLYHGTYKPMDPDDPWKHLRPGSDEGMDMWGEGIYLGDSDLANIHAGAGTSTMVGSRMYPMMVRGEKIFNTDKFSKLRSEAIYKIDDKRARELGWEGAMSEYMTSMGYGDLNTNWDDLYDDKARAKLLKELGYEGFTTGGTTVVWDPKNMRSPHAQFKDMGSKDMLANWVGPGILGAGVAARATRDRENYVERYRDGGIVSLHNRKNR
jgi:hypothetical protein